jgi:hypothetical protein
VEDAPRFFFAFTGFDADRTGLSGVFETPADSPQKLWIILNRP